MSTTERSAKDLEKGLFPHVHYEINQLVRMLTCAPCDQTWSNARIESIAIHVRVLLDFFKELNTGNVTKNPDDMHASEFGFTQTFPDESDLRMKVNKDLAHLTWSRVERYPEQSQWTLEELIPLLAICAQFCRHICDNFDLGSGKDPWKDLCCRLNCYIKGDEWKEK